MEYIKTVGETPTPQIMEQPPEYITTKDLAYLKDALSWELTAMKKCYHFSMESKEPDVKNILEKTCRMHQNHYDILLKHVDSNKSIF